jgi:oligopeptide/dipeptide ABC transporter ATP-binding protein
VDLQQELQLTFLFITHNLAVVKHISSNICVMYLGCVVEFSKSEDLFINPLHPYTKALLSAIPTISIHTPNNRILLQGEVTSPIEPPDSCRFAPRCQYAEEVCFLKHPVLEEVEANHFVACHMVRKINQLSS